MLVDAYMKPETSYHNVFMARPNTPLGPSYVELKDKKKYFGYDLIFDKELIKLKNE